MNPQQSIICTRSLKRYAPIMIILALFGFFCILGGLVQTPSTPHSAGETVATSLFGGFFVLLVVILWATLPATLVVTDGILTLRKRKLFTSVKSINLQDIARLDVLWGRNREPTLILYDQTKHNLWLDLSGYPMKDKLALLPTLQELCNRPGVQKDQDEVIKALNAWYPQ